MAKFVVTETRMTYVGYVLEADSEDGALERFFEGAQDATLLFDEVADSSEAKARLATAEDIKRVQG